MDTFDIMFVTLLGFIFTLLTTMRVKQEIKKHEEKMENQLAEIKKLINGLQKHG